MKEVMNELPEEIAGQCTLLEGLVYIKYGYIPLTCKLLESTYSGIEYIDSRKSDYRNIETQKELIIEYFLEKENIQEPYDLNSSSTYEAKAQEVRGRFENIIEEGIYKLYRYIKNRKVDIYGIRFGIEGGCEWDEGDWEKVEVSDISIEDINTEEGIISNCNISYKDVLVDFMQLCNLEPTNLNKYIATSSKNILHSDIARKGANKKNKDTNLIKTQIIKQMFVVIQQNGLDKNRTYNVAEISRKIISQLNQQTEESLMKEYNFKEISTLKKAIQYNNDKAGGQIESWCYQVNKGQL